MRAANKTGGALTRIAAWALALAALSALAPAANADEVGSKNRKANRLYDKGKYGEALKLYDEAALADPSEGKLKMNRGSALYRLEELEEAERSYLDALSLKNGKQAQADAHYNLGNILYRQGERLEAAGEAASARGKYSQALSNYIDALKLRPGDRDAKWNLQLAHQKVEELQGQQNQQQDQQQDKQQGDGDDKEKKPGGRGEEEKREEERQSDPNEEGENQEQQNQEDRPRPREGEEGDMKREEAERLIEQFADDADSLNKPRFPRGRIRQPDKDW